jgi:uncharacterized protein YkwD
MRNYSIPTLFFSAMLVLAGLTVSASAQPAAARLVSGDTQNSSGKAGVRYLERDVLALINKQREQNGLNPLVWDSKSAEVARVHSRDMGWNNFFNHRGQDGKMVNERADALGLDDWQMIGENIAMVGGFKDPVDHVVQGWMDSSGHRKNILDPRWKETGIGIFINSEGTYYFTQVFLSRK